MADASRTGQRLVVPTPGIRSAGRTGAGRWATAAAAGRRSGQEGRHQNRADHAGVEHHAERQGEAQLEHARSVPVIIEMNVPAMITPQLVMMPPVRATASRSPQRAVALLFFDAPA